MTKANKQYGEYIRVYEHGGGSYDRVGKQMELRPNGALRGYKQPEWPPAARGWRVIAEYDAEFEEVETGKTLQNGEPQKRTYAYVTITLREFIDYEAIKTVHRKLYSVKTLKAAINKTIGDVEKIATEMGYKEVYLHQKHANFEFGEGEEEIKGAINDYEW